MTTRPAEELLRASGLPRAEARALLAHVLGVARERLIAHPQTPVTPGAAATFAALAARRGASEPLAYLLGSKDFYGRVFTVSPAVLIPRPETELLVDIACNALRARPAPRVLDLGTGSGCIAITLALELPGADVWAVDASEAALAVARANARQLGARVGFLHGAWYAPVQGHFDVIVANPPYVARGDRHLSEGDLRYEPAHALVGGADGLDDLRIIVADAPAHLSPGALLAVEHGYDQAAAVRALLNAAGFVDVGSERDGAQIERVTFGRSR
jgi:release factor glutamine methyltransferase